MPRYKKTDLDHAIALLSGFDAAVYVAEHLKAAGWDSGSVHDYLRTAVDLPEPFRQAVYNAMRDLESQFRDEGEMTSAIERFRASGEKLARPRRRG